MVIAESLQFLKSFKDVFGLVKEAKDLLPESPKKTEITVKIEAAEESLKIAETEAAKSLGHKLCQCTWPTQIMRFDKSKNVDRCPNCGDEIKRRTKNDWPIQSFKKKPK